MTSFRPVNQIQLLPSSSSVAQAFELVAGFVGYRSGSRPRLLVAGQGPRRGCYNVLAQSLPIVRLNLRAFSYPTLQ